MGPVWARRRDGRVLENHEKVEPCILVGVDFSDASRRALDHAISLCAKLDADWSSYTLEPDGLGLGT